MATAKDLPGLSPEARAFSGTVSHLRTFNAADASALQLDLGRVESVAEAFVNGRRVRRCCRPASSARSSCARRVGEAQA